MPKVTNIKKSAGIAGQFQVSADVEYWGESAERVAFVGSVYGGPIVMVTPARAEAASRADLLTAAGNHTITVGSE